ncbi:MAG: uracil-DNA glycosylase, partial [Liquorilactobacillus satsumensis]
MKTLIHNDWQAVLGPEFEKEYYKRLHAFLKKEYTTKQIY